MMRGVTWRASGATCDDKKGCEIVKQLRVGCCLWQAQGIKLVRSRRNKQRWVLLQSHAQYNVLYDGNPKA
jgi:hypothetical protein